MYLHSISFLHVEMGRVAEIISCGQKPINPEQSISWLLLWLSDDASNQGISRRYIELVIQEYYRLNTVVARWYNDKITDFIWSFLT